MLDSRLVSAVRGGVSQPAGGGLRLQIVLRSKIKRGSEYQSLQMTLQWVWQGTTYSNVLKLGLLFFVVTLALSAPGHVSTILEDSPVE